MFKCAKKADFMCPAIKIYKFLVLLYDIVLLNLIRELICETNLLL